MLYFRLALAAVEHTHNTSLYSELRQRLQQATGDEIYSVDQESAITFISVTNRKAAIMVCIRVTLLFAHVLMPISMSISWNGWIQI